MFWNKKPEKEFKKSLVELVSFLNNNEPNPDNLPHIKARRNVVLVKYKKMPSNKAIQANMIVAYNLINKKMDEKTRSAGLINSFESILGFLK